VRAYSHLSCLPHTCPPHLPALHTLPAHWVPDLGTLHTCLPLPLTVHLQEMEGHHTCLTPAHAAATVPHSQRADSGDKILQEKSPHTSHPLFCTSFLTAPHTLHCTTSGVHLGGAITCPLSAPLKAPGRSHHSRLCTCTWLCHIYITQKKENTPPPHLPTLRSAACTLYTTPSLHLTASLMHPHLL